VTAKMAVTDIQYEVNVKKKTWQIERNWFRNKISTESIGYTKVRLWPSGL
jgi:hypothetical protein